ncbi:MAG TPA: autotransporter domain-containing protein [Hyphomicrobiaceae bacterium]|jgi:uncharacterized protein YhjY with autotransporter beta-barrel domain/phospholipase/lecithinase/hemolysin|nr:autotransporter domain-containing protein [Hyphomicrobiaceae bacterium]
MRHPRSFAWAHSAAVAAALVAATLAVAPSASAQQKFDNLFVFGDSYADLTLSDKPASNLLAPTLPNGDPLGLSLWRVYPLSLQAELGIPNIVDVAVGGATASPLIGPPGVPPFLNLPQQVGAFLAPKPLFGPNDLITLNIGGNDARELVKNGSAAGYPSVPFTKDNAKTFADLTTGYVMTTAIDPLVRAGARTFVLGEFSSISGLPELQPNFNANPELKKAADDYAQAYFNGMQAALLPHAQSGVRFFLFDLARLGDAVNKDPGKFGFSGGFICPRNGLEGLAAAICGATRENPTNNNPLQTQYYFGPDGLHLTNGGFDLVGRYMANIVQAPGTIAVQTNIVQATTGGFVSSLFGHLDATRDVRNAGGYAAAPDGQMGLGATDKSRVPQTAPSSGRITSYALGTFLGGNRSDAVDLVGYDYDSTSGTAGFEVSINRNLIFGLAGNYTTAAADLNNGANVDIDSIQAAAYLSYATKQVFAEVLAAYASHEVNLARPGVIDTIRSDTDASAMALAARGGYLFDFGAVRAGPIAGLTYVHARVGGYTEKGDDLLTFNVEAQTIDSLTGNAGFRFLAPFRTSAGFVVPYLNFMIEHQFGDSARTLTVDQVQTNLFLPIMTSVSNFDTRTYGRIEGGISFELGPQLGAVINAASTFGRDEGEDYRVSAGLSYRF